MNNKVFGVILLICFLVNNISAQSNCFEKYKQEGIRLYNVGEHRKANDYFDLAEGCPGKPIDNNLKQLKTENFKAWEKAVDEKYSLFLSSEARNYFEHNQIWKSFRLAQLAKKFDKKNKVANHLLETLPPFFSDLKIDNAVDYKLSSNEEYLGVVVKRENEFLLEVWNIKTSKLIHTFFNVQLSDSERPYNSYKFAETGDYIGVLSLDENSNKVELELWDLKNYRLFQTLSNIPKSGSNSYNESYRFTETGGHIAVLTTKEDSDEIQLEIFDFKSPEPVHIFSNIQKTDSNSYNESYRFTETGDNIAVLTTKENSNEIQLEIFDLKNPKLVHIFSNIQNVDSDSYYDSYRFTETGDYIAVLTAKVDSDEIQLEILDFKSPKTLQIFSNIQKSEDEGYFDSYRFTETGDYIAVLNSEKGSDKIQLEVWDLKSQILINTFFNIQPSDSYGNSYGFSYRFSDNGNFFATLNKKEDSGLVQLEVWDLKSQKPVHIFKNVRESETISFNDTSRNVVRIIGGSEMRTYSYKDSYRFTQVGDRIAVLTFQVDSDEVQLEVWDLEVPKPIHTFFNIQKSENTRQSKDDFYGYSCSYGFSEIGNYIAVLNKKEGSGKTQLEVWDLNYPKHIQTFINIKKGSDLSYIDSYRFAEEGNCISVLTTRNESNKIQLEVWDLKSQKSISTFFNIQPSDNYKHRHRESYNFQHSYKFTKNGNYMAVLSLMKGSKSCQLEVLDINNRRLISPIYEIQMSGNFVTNYNYSYHFSENGDYLAALRNNNKIQIIPIKLFGNGATQVLCHLGTVIDFEFSVKGSLLISRTKEGVLKVIKTNISTNQFYNHFNNLFPNLNDFSDSEKERLGL